MTKDELLAAIRAIDSDLWKSLSGGCDDPHWAAIAIRDALSAAQTAADSAALERVKGRMSDWTEQSASRLDERWAGWLAAHLAEEGDPRPAYACSFAAGRMFEQELNNGR